MNHRTVFRLSWSGLLAIIIFAGVAMACNIPVFRYALERWPADPYRVAIFYRSELTLEQRQQVEKLESANANIEVALIDTTRPIPDSQRGMLSPEVNTFPWMVAAYPAASRIQVIVHAGELSPANTESLLRSPARQEIARRILGGETAVWLFLPGGDPTRDDAARKLLESELTKLPEVLKLPEINPADQSKVDGPPLRIGFSLLSIDRNDPREKALLSMLLKSEPDLVGLKGPMVFPVFGRGRVLYALIDAGITTQNIHETAGYLVAACSCEVKREHPGVDLLISTDWDASLKGNFLSEALSPSGGDGERVPIPSPKRQDVIPKEESSRRGLFGVFAVGSVLALVAGVFLSRLRQRLP